MGTVKHREGHKKQLLKFKKQVKQQNMSQVTQPQMPEVRSVPTWTPDAKIEINGYEWEAIQNALTNVQIGQQAAQSVMTRNIINGVIRMDFEKLNAQSLQYEPMTDEEKAPFLENFAKAVDAIKNPASTDIPSATEPVSQDEGAKIITMS